MADAGAAALATGPGRVAEEFAEEIEQRRVVLGALDILQPDRRDVPMALRAQPVAMGIGAAADIHLSRLAPRLGSPY